MSAGAVTVTVEDGRVIVSEGTLTLLAFFHPNAEGAARELARLIPGAVLA